MKQPVLRPARRPRDGVTLVEILVAVVMLTVTDGRNIKPIAVNIQIPRRTNTLVYSMVIPCRD